MPCIPSDTLGVTVLDATYPECYFRCYCTWCRVSRMLLYVSAYLISCPECYFRCYCTWCQIARMLLYLMSSIPNVTLGVIVLDVGYPDGYFMCYRTWCQVSRMLLYVLLYLMPRVPHVTLCVTVLDVTWPVSLTSRQSLFVYRCSRTCLLTKSCGLILTQTQRTWGRHWVMRDGSR